MLELIRLVQATLITALRSRGRLVIENPNYFEARDVTVTLNR